MTRTCLRHKVSALATVTLISLFASSPAWAPAPVCPTCSVKTLVSPFRWESPLLRSCEFAWWAWSRHPPARLSIGRLGSLM